MPFVFLVIGILLLVIAVQGTQDQAFTMLKGEFTGSNSFVVFAAAIIILGAIAYIKPVRPIAFAMIGMVLLAVILKNKGGFFSQLNDALRNPVAPSAVSSGTTSAFNPASTTLQTTPSESIPGVQNPYFANPFAPISPGNVPDTGGGLTQY